MDFDLSEEQRLLVDSARAFAAHELSPHAADWDRDHHFPTDVIRRAAEQGYLALYLPEADGGLGLSRLSASLIFEQLSAGCVATTAFLTIHNMASWMLASFADRLINSWPNFIEVITREGWGWWGAGFGAVGSTGKVYPVPGLELLSIADNIQQGLFNQFRVKTEIRDTWVVIPDKLHMSGVIHLGQLADSFQHLMHIRGFFTRSFVRT